LLLLLVNINSLTKEHLLIKVKEL